MSFALNAAEPTEHPKAKEPEEEEKQ